ncbi:unnamed protein product [Parnassius apollo]|uniref:(apollo) hypothetical protein n=1 Tax=Parnassius apollo TaxID=110799 RepID=A0A8S3XUP5_PARAO|nr:unnamed protein product [Parnassius apollo]
MVSPVAKQTWAISAVLINMLAQGMMLSYPSSLLPGIQAADSDIKVDLNTASWLASMVGLASIPGFLVSSILMDWVANLGCTPIPLALLGEVLPLAHRGSGSAVAGLVMSLIMVVALQITPYLLESVKVYGTFTVFGSAMGLSLVTLYFILPETKDRTLQEIEDYFNYGRFRNEEEPSNNKEDVKMKMII